MSLKLVSIHIPKTAGHSFKGVLTSVFGKENILHANASHGYFKIIGGERLFNFRHVLMEGREAG